MMMTERYVAVYGISPLAAGRTASPKTHHPNRKAKYRWRVPLFQALTRTWKKGWSGSPAPTYGTHNLVLPNRSPSRNQNDIQQILSGKYTGPGHAYRHYLGTTRVRGELCIEKSK
jgi:hypothetical protein